MLDKLGTILVVIAIPAVRVLAGWINSSLKDYNKEEHGWQFWKAIQTFEVELLISTEFVTIVGGLAAYFGFDALGLDISLIGSIIAATVVDWFIKTYKK